MRLLQDDYFAEPPPKSTGLEYFNPGWLQRKLVSFSKLPPEDIQATLSALTARSIAAAIRSYAPATQQVLVCGGGVHNSHLLDQLAAELSAADITSTEAFGLHPDWVEAAAFAWLAKRCLERKSGNLPSVTGATQDAILGGIYLSSS
jgi:anhydro-N-acetylmuramic acid kinase